MGIYWLIKAQNLEVGQVLAKFIQKFTMSPGLGCCYSQFSQLPKSAGFFHELASLTSSDSQKSWLPYSHLVDRVTLELLFKSLGWDIQG